ncbi:cation:proton antiporter [Actinomyces capricornis]|nr:cation:proton antiporter [Actinomyces capricornis]
MEPLVMAVAALLVIAACHQLAPRVGVASPLILLSLGIGIGFLPWVGAIKIDPGIILEAVLPPLLFGAAVSMPVMDFRRELRSVAVLAGGLVVLSALVLGAVIHALVPAISLPWAIAVGAVLSPTDAVAVSIARGSGVSHRIITILEGEGLFNDATALVLLASATSAALMTDAHALSPAGLAWDLVVALVVALAVGWAVGELTVRVRRRITDPAADTVVSFTVPFLASLPAGQLGGSGLVAAVVAGLVVSYRGPRLLAPASRSAADKNWRTVELILEGAVFLVMGLQAYGIVHEVQAQGLGLGPAIRIALLTGVLTVALRAGFVAPLLVWLRWIRSHRRRRLEAGQERVRQIESRLALACRVDDEVLASRNLSRQDWERALARWHRRLESGQRRQRRARSDMAYFLAATLGPREGAVIVWAGMRGAVTLAASQTLPLSAPMRPFLLFLALLVAGGSLVIQGLSLPLLIRLARPQMSSGSQDAEERERLMAVLGGAVKDTALAQCLSEGARPDALAARALSAVGPALSHGQEGLDPRWSAAAGADRPQEPGGPADGAARAGSPGSAPLGGGPEDRLSAEQVRDMGIEAIRIQREALLDARDEGLFTAATLQGAMQRLDAEEIMLSTRG